MLTNVESIKVLGLCFATILRLLNNNKNNNSSDKNNKKGKKTKVVEPGREKEIDR